MRKKILISSASLIASVAMTCASAAPYVGADLGVNVNTEEYAANFRGIPLTLFAGYGTKINQEIYLGGEAFVVPGTGEMSSSHGNYLRSTYSYGLSFMPGVSFTEHTLGFARLGVVRAHFDKEDDGVNGAQFGLGMQTSLTKNFDLRGEYVFTAYDSFNGNSSPKSDQFNLGFVYKFM